ncbi:MAG: ATP-dependent 6-phosphofructokinase [Armatimonadota bacterium]|nr:MAG: ATP-dependent 6-phosphofructokinase [Armatimonadota bacterium]
MRIGVLTGGGDCPGLNPAIRAIVMRAFDYGDELVGLRQGWRGLREKETMPLTLELVEPIIDSGGTILESSRTNPVKDAESTELCLDNARELGLDALIALGGEDTLGGAHKLCARGLKCVGVPKTMDNDLSATDYTFGFDSAVSVAVDAADRLKDTARSHRRVLVLEVMGRHAGWVALHTGVCAGADYILIPEIPLDRDGLIEHIKEIKARGKHWGLVVVSEGVKPPEVGEGEKHAKDEFGHEKLGGIGGFVAAVIEKGSGIDTRYVTLGHVVRGGSPTPFDRWLATRVGIKAVELVHEGKFDHMAALQGNQIVAVPLADAVENLKTVPTALYEEVKTLFSQ